MAHVSLYRRYRPGRFAALRGQDHIVRALTHAVATETSSHAYLFSGPRGTGKTSTARILAKALNCTNLNEGEPCGECESCQAIEAGTSYDLFELDAASNNGVDAMRDLISRTAVGSPGRTKVYILDEVHMLSPAASNALLKTLEEPPDHVAFVLATTDPQKVLPTIRSRTQHLEFQLLTAAELDDYVRWVVADAGLTLDDASIAQVVRQGRGSARDTLSALDLAVAAGGISDRVEPVDGILSAISDRDVGAAIVAVGDAVAQGREPRVLAEALLATLRDAFLVAVGADSALLSDIDRERLTELSRRIGTPALTRSLEGLGAALVDMRQASDPRVPLEVALVRLCDPALDTSVASLLERIERLERQTGRQGAVSPRTGPNAAESSGAESSAAGASAPGASASGASASGASAERTAGVDSHDPAAPAPRAPRPAGSGIASAARSELARAESVSAPPPARPAPPVPPGRNPPPNPPGSAEVSDATVEPAPTAAPVTSSEGFPTRDELASAMGDHVLASLRGIAKAIYSGGRFVAATDDAAVFALNNAATRDRAERVRVDVEAALAAHFGRPIPLRLVDESAATGTGVGAAPEPAGAEAAPVVSAGAASPVAAAPGAAAPVAAASDDEMMDRSEVAELDDAPDVAAGGVDRLVQAFPGAVVVEQENP